MHQIRTKWHKIIPLIEAGNGYVTAPKEGMAAHLSEYSIDGTELVKYIQCFSDLPKFYIDADLMYVARDAEYFKSLIDMKKAGVMRLPYPAMIVEFDSLRNKDDPGGYCHYCIMLRDTQAEGSPFKWEEAGFSQQHHLPFYGWAFRVQRDKDGEYLVVAPSISFITPDKNENGETWVRIKAQGWFREKNSPLDKAVNDLINVTYVKDGGAVWHGLCAALLLMNTAGTGREVIEPTKLNRRRALLNKPPIPRHTYIHISKVYKSADSQHAEPYEARRSPRPHWRRGHNRTVLIGKGRTGTKLIYIEPKLVAYHPGETPEPPQTHEYVVTR